MLVQGILSKLKAERKKLSQSMVVDWPPIKDTMSHNFAEQRNENSLTRDVINLRQGPSENPQQF